MRCPLAILIAVLLASTNAAADQTETRFSLTNTLVGEYRTNNKNGDDDDDRYGVLIDRFNMKLVHGDLTASGRVDVSGFIDPPDEGFRNDGRWERISLQWRKGDLTLVGGDYFRQLGRGIILSIRKVDEAGRDLAIRGGQARYNGDTHRASLFAGVVNPANLDSIAQKFVEDVDDLLVGGHYELGLDFMQVGLHGLLVRPEETILPESLIGEDGGKDQTLNAGLYAEFPELTSWLSLYIEADLQRRQIAGADGDKNGQALYATADVSAAGFVVLFEGLFLNDFEQRGTTNSAVGNRFDYNQPPTLERLDQEVFNNRDTLGGRVRVEYLIEDAELLLYANGMLRLNDFGDPQQLRIIHAFAGFELAFSEGSRFFLSGGYRDESLDSGQVKSMIHAETDTLFTLGDGVALHIVSNNEFRTLEDTRYERGSTLIGVEMAGVGGITMELGYDTQDPSEDVRRFFLAAILNLEVNSVFTVRATGGTQRGGIKCIAGVCRDFPEFAGARAEIIARM